MHIFFFKETNLHVSECAYETLYKVFIRNETITKKSLKVLLFLNKLSSTKNNLKYFKFVLLFLIITTSSSKFLVLART